MVVNPFENMKLGSAVRESKLRREASVATSRPAGWPCGGSCSDPDQPAPAPGGAPQAPEGGVLRRARRVGRRRSRRRRRLVPRGSAADGRTSSSATSSCTAEIKKLEVQIKDIATLRAEIDSLKARQQAVEDLQIDRNMPVHLLNELVKQTPEGMYLTTRQAGRRRSLNLPGIAQTQERVSEFLRNTAYNSRVARSSRSWSRARPRRARPPIASRSACSISRHAADGQAAAGRCGRGAAGAASGASLAASVDAGRLGAEALRRAMATNRNPSAST